MERLTKYVLGLGFMVGVVLTPMNKAPLRFDKAGIEEKVEYISWLQDSRQSHISEVVASYDLDPLRHIKLKPIISTSETQPELYSRWPPRTKSCWSFGEHGKYRDIWRYNPKLGKCCGNPYDSL